MRTPKSLFSEYLKFPERNYYTHYLKNKPKAMLTKEVILSNRKLLYGGMKLTDESALYAMQDYADQETAALKSENESLKAALKELVEVERLKLTFELWAPEMEGYEKRKKLAWEAARKLLNPEVLTIKSKPQQP